jgi:PAS domain S-box-containing protein
MTAWSLGYFRLLDVMPLARDSLIGTLQDGVLVVDAQGRIIDLNPAAQRHLALDESAVGRAAASVLAAWPELAGLCTRHSHAQVEVTLDGGRRHSSAGAFEVQTSPLNDRQGRYIGSMVVLRDITARKAAEAAEQARQVAEASYRAIRQIVDTVEEGLILLDPDRRVAMANQVGQAHLALLANLAEDASIDALAGRPLEELAQPPEGLPYHTLQLDGPLPATFEVAVRPLPPSEFPSGWVLATRDVTQAHQLQQRMEQQERLAAIGQLAAGIAHDFNNVLAVILLYTGLLERSQNLLPKQREQLEILSRQANHASNLVQQILDFSRKAMIETHLVDLAPFLRDVAELCRRTLPDHIRVELDGSPGPVYVRGDLLRLQAALLNLAFNARDAMPEGGTLRLRLACRQVEEAPPLPELTPGEWAIVQVCDTGSGIAPDVQPHLFEPFFTTKEPGSGTGLGLAQVFGIVKQHQGAIGVESQMGVGTTFTLYLPLAAPQEAGPA